MRDLVSTLVDTVRQDARYGVRMIRRGPMLSVTAVATVALSTAAIATVVTLADTLLWRQFLSHTQRVSSPSPRRATNFELTAPFHIPTTSPFANARQR